MGIDGGRLRIMDVDIQDGTPLVDIKPYVPQFDCFGGSRTGWLQNKGGQGVVADDRFEQREPALGWPDQGSGCLAEVGFFG